MNPLLCLNVSYITHIILERIVGQIQTWVPIPEKVTFDGGNCWPVTPGGGGVGVWDELELFNELVVFAANCCWIVVHEVGGELWE